ncbi:putative serine/threonine protein phosphatase type 5 [Histomonas meleagridis]|uniref:putative serine/threonine protein phosphatase type 5 n=1 Tax=Histomonas meleagridis TaxID=135588 RepID=UPI00355A989C|nr:putative serine/threonine protein phosphatase type 5 [Histomonas meleagridis]KAH0797799.1 putative serine/threonine protein phosphatase type 5 [Histomonas meleagridis]
MRKIFGFRSAALGWYGQEVADALDKAIDSFPFCTIVNDKYFVINGGIPVSNDINVVASPESYWGETSNTLGIQRKAPVSYYTFGPDVVNDFLSANKFELLIRSGQKKADGFQYEYDGKVLNISSGRGGTRVHKSGVAVITGDGVTPNSYDLNPRFPITVHAETDSPGLTGIFYKLRHDFDIENPMDLNLFYVKSSSPIEDIPPVETVVSSTYSFGFMTYPTPGNSHIAFIFKGLITVEAYTIESAPLNKGNDHMKTWKLLGTNDGKTLEVIDERSNVNELNGPLATATFKVKDPKPYKMLILLQHEKNHRGNWNLCLNHIDFFGTLQ